MRFAGLIALVGLSGLAGCSSGDNLSPSSGQPEEGSRVGLSPSGEVNSSFRVIK
jgi:hypothetical protein